MTDAIRAAALRHATHVLDELTATQLQDLVRGRGRLVFRPDPVPRPRRAPGPDPVAAETAAAAAAIDRLASPADVAQYLERGRFATPELKAIARALGPTVSSSGRTRADLVRDIVDGTAGFRTRSAAMSGGAWS